MRISVNQTVIEIRQADITLMDTAAIVNAANERLAHGGGVAGAISRQGGPEIGQESLAWVQQHGPVATGKAAITGAGNLKARYVIHAVGPVMGSGDEDGKLASATKSALALAEHYRLDSISFPAISTGIFGYPMERCSRVMLTTVLEHVRMDTCLRLIVFCLWEQKAFAQFVAMLNTLSQNSEEKLCCCDCL